MRLPSLERPVAALAFVVIMASCFSEQGTEITTPSEGECRLPANSPAIGALGVVVAMRDFEFQPAEIRVPRGARVTWVNCEPATLDPHTSTADGGEWGSSLLNSGQSFSRVFDQTGRFDYHCAPHPFMRGVVIVE
jgi:plastocyanin